MIKAAFFDVDGTLVSFQTHSVPESARKALIRAREKGLKLFVATGRHIETVDNLGDLEFDGYLTLNGGLCMMENRKMIYKRAIPESDIRNMIELQKDFPFPVVFVREHGMFLNYFNADVREVLDFINFPQPRIEPIENALDTDVLQLMVFLPEKEIKSLMPAIPACEATRWHPLFADVVPKGSNKGIGIDKIIAYAGIDLKDTIAFGDGGNDIPMLIHAGIGVAMGNAREEVKKSADYVTSTVDEDGIYRAMEHFGLL